jgi:hypothetical protein
MVAEKVLDLISLFAHKEGKSKDSSFDHEDDWESMKLFLDDQPT